MSRSGRRGAEGDGAGRVGWAAPASFSFLALAYCLFTGIDPGHTALITASGACLGFVYSLLALWAGAARAPLHAARPASGSEAFRGVAFALLSGRVRSHGAAAEPLRHALETAAGLAGDPDAVGPEAAWVLRVLAADGDVPARRALAAARQARSWLAAYDAGAPAPLEGTR
ncbi:hypothetical protein ACQ3I4_03690 [Zafaria sp. Z1313]|uniref:hypothetical protein n=1 Tax=unclassified Zafaria TaxID=2828765 RepID=UPI002E7790CB|nr:hypothetical protein [Zafaria sp. J156]MEE1620863.1 hypothetical protein [Zafaria sp. J156]